MREDINPTIFNIIPWDDGSRGQSSCGLTAQCLKYTKSKSLSHCPTALFSIYQNKHWTIRQLDDRSVDPSSSPTILKIVWFHMNVHLEFGWQQMTSVITHILGLNSTWYYLISWWDDDELTTSISNGVSFSEWTHPPKQSPPGPIFYYIDTRVDEISVIETKFCKYKKDSLLFSNRSS